MGCNGRALSATQICSEAQTPRSCGTESIKGPPGLCSQHSCCAPTPTAACCRDKCAGSQDEPQSPGCRGHGGGLAREQDEALGLCSCRQFPIKELMRDEGPQRAVISVRRSAPMVCQILTIGAVGWAPAGLIFHRLPPHCLERQRPPQDFPRPFCLIPGY